MKRILISLIAASSIFAVSCDFGPLETAIDEFALVIGLEPITTNASVLVYDAVTNELVASDITVTIGGENGDQVIDIFSDPIVETSFEGGTFNFGLNNAFTPDEQNPAVVSVTFNAAGYLESTSQIQLAEEGLTSFEVEMIPLSNLPENITQSTQTSDTDGAGNPVPPSEMTPPQAKGAFTTPSTENLQFLSIFARNGSATAESFATSFTLRNGTTPPAGPYFSSSQSLQINLGATGEGLSPLPTVGGNTYTPNIQITRTLKIGSAEIASIQGGNGEIWTLLGRASALATTASYQALLAGELYLFESNSAAYDGSTPTLLTVVPLTASTSDVSTASGFADIITSTSSSPKIVSLTVSGSNDPYIWLAQGGIAYKYNAFATRTVLKNITFVTELNGYTGARTREISVLGTTFNRTIAAGVTTNSWVRQIPSVNANGTFAVTHWGTTVQNFNPSEVNTVTITIPTKPSNLILGTVTANLVCTNGAPGLRLDGLPATPIQFRKKDSGTRWSQANVTWNYDAAARVLRGGSFTANMESGVDYEFQISVDGTVYPTNGPEVKTITFTNAVASFDYSIDNDDFCAQ